MFIQIVDAPFTEAEKEAIIAMGYTASDWGHPDIVLDDPVAYFKEVKELRESVISNTGATPSMYELDESPKPFGV